MYMSYILIPLFSLSSVFLVCIVEFLHAIVAIEGLSCFKGNKRIN